MTDAMIELKQVSKRFDDCQALNGVSLAVPKGAVYGLVGPNGAGKSTLIQHVTGAYKQDSGEVLVDGQPIFENLDVKARVACIPSDFYFHPQANIEAMVDLYEGIFPNFSKERFNELRKNFDLDTKRQLRKFSKGMQKQAAFWLALSQRPEVLLLDEPLDGLDPLMRRRMWSLVLSEVAETGLTVLVSSHNLRELEGVCDHMGIMRAGAMLREYDLDSVTDGLIKVQVAFPNGVDIPAGLEIVHHHADGRLLTLVIRGAVEEVRATLEACNPVLLETIPLSLEELFLYELGGVSDDLKELVL